MLIEIDNLEIQIERASKGGIKPVGPHPTPKVITGTAPSAEAAQNNVVEAAAKANRLATVVATAEMEVSRIKGDITEAEGAKVCDKCGQSIVN